MDLTEAFAVLGLSVENKHEVAAIDRLLSIKIKIASKPPPKDD